MEVLEEKPLMMWDVIRLLEKRKGDKKTWDKTEQRNVYEYAQKVVKLPEDKAKELYERLVGELSIPSAVAVQIVDILPVTVNEIEHFLDFMEEIMESEGKILSPDERGRIIEKMLKLIREEYYPHRIMREEESGESKAQN